MKVFTLLICTLFFANGVFSESGGGSPGQNNSPKKKNLNNLMGHGAEDAAKRMEPENAKLREARELEKGGHILESQVARGLALDHYSEKRINQDQKELENEKLKVEELKIAYKEASAKFVAAAKDNKTNKDWIKGADAAKLKSAVIDAEIALRNAEIDCKGHERAIDSAREAISAG